MRKEAPTSIGGGGCHDILSSIRNEEKRVITLPSKDLIAEWMFQATKDYYMKESAFPDDTELEGIVKHYGQGHKRQTEKRGLLTTSKG